MNKISYIILIISTVPITLFIGHTVCIYLPLVAAFVSTYIYNIKWIKKIIDLEYRTFISVSFVMLNIIVLMLIPYVLTLTHLDGVFFYILRFIELIAFIIYIYIIQDLIDYCSKIHHKIIHTTI